MEPEDWAHVSQAGRELVRQLLAYKPEARPTAAQLLQHSWIQQRAAAAAAPVADRPEAASAHAAVLPESAGRCRDGGRMCAGRLWCDLARFHWGMLVQKLREWLLAWNMGRSVLLFLCHIA